MRCMTRRPLDESAMSGSGMSTPWIPAALALAAMTCISLASRRKSNSFGTVSLISSRICETHQASYFIVC